MNTKTERLLDAIAVAVCNERDDLIRSIHIIIAADRDNYPYDFIATVNSFRCLLGSDKLSINYEQSE
jgi:hypothetical protein